MVDDQDVEEAREAGCATPRRSECRIPVALGPPPPPKKKPFAFEERKSDPPKNGYFQPPDLDLLFAMAPRRQACA